MAEQAAARRPYEGSAARLRVLPRPSAQHRLAGLEFRDVEEVPVPAQRAVGAQLEIFEPPSQIRVQRGELRQRLLPRARRRVAGSDRAAFDMAGRGGFRGQDAQHAQCVALVLAQPETAQYRQCDEHHDEADRRESQAIEPGQRARGGPGLVQNGRRGHGDRSARVQLGKGVLLVRSLRGHAEFDGSVGGEAGVDVCVLEDVVLDVRVAEVCVAEVRVAELRCIPGHARSGGACIDEFSHVVQRAGRPSGATLHSMSRAPAMQDLSPDLARAARAIAEGIGADGGRAWIVGGAPRDLILGGSPHEIDMASELDPDRIQALFPRTTPLGRAFGTVIVHLQGVDVEHTTFRTESEYADGRRPDAVRFGASVEEDALRRDFTCNAIFLDPLNDEVRDPVGGIADLAARRLACVGDPGERFREDALRPLRMARFAGGLGLEPTAATAEAARQEAEGLRRVSRERVLRELAGMFRRPGAAVCVGWMERCGLLEPALPGFGALGRGAPGALGAGALRTRAVAALREPAGTERGLAVLLGPTPEDLADPSSSRALLVALRTSRLTQTTVEDGWRLAGEVLADRAPTRATRLRWMRRPGFDVGVAWLEAWSRAAGAGDGPSPALIAERASLTPGELEPQRLLEAADLARHGIAAGPRYGEILRALETEQLDLRVHTRDEALAWLARQ